jgi:glucose-6-phosphate isomerase
MDFQKIGQYMAPFVTDLDLNEGMLKGFRNHSVRNASSMRGYYKDSVTLDAIIASGDPLHYEVFENTVPEEYGHIIVGISKLYAGVVGDECFMTKGHYHKVLATGEIYLCLRGQGYLLMKTKDGDFSALEMERGKIVYVPPFWAHRSVNTGEEPLISLFAYNAESGHNYGDIEVEGFIKRVFKRKGAISIE